MITPESPLAADVGGVGTDKNLLSRPATMAGEHMGKRLLLRRLGWSMKGR
jgi:hypothetical protein